MRAHALGMDDALGNALAVMVSQLLDQLPVLHEDRAAIAGGKAVLIVSDRRAGAGRQAWGRGVPWRHRRSLLFCVAIGPGRSCAMFHEPAVQPWLRYGYMPWSRF